MSAEQSTPIKPEFSSEWDEDRYRCATCGDPIKIGEVARLMIPFRDGYLWAHASDDGQGCDGRFWDPPGPPDPDEGNR